MLLFAPSCTLSFTMKILVSCLFCTSIIYSLRKHQYHIQRHAFKSLQHMPRNKAQYLTDKYHKTLKCLAKILPSIVLAYSTTQVVKSINETLLVPTIEVPMELYDNVFCIKYSIIDANNQVHQFRGIVDTGSPFLIVPGVCTKTWGCGDSNSYSDAPLEDTVEIFGGQEYETTWKKAHFNFYSNFPSASLTSQYAYYTSASKEITFASVGREIMLPPGGVFVGLIKYKEDRIRPTFLEQLGYSSFKFDTKMKILKLSKLPYLNQVKYPSSKVIPLVDLRKFGDPVSHYVAKVKSLMINKKVIKHFSEIYCVFDTGTTGCILSEELALDESTPQPVRSVSISVESEVRGKDIKFEAKATHDNVFVVNYKRIPWFNNYDTKQSNSVAFVSRQSETFDADIDWNLEAIDSSRIVYNNNGEVKFLSKRQPEPYNHKPQIVVIGLEFMKLMRLTVDIDEKRLHVHSYDSG